MRSALTNKINFIPLTINSFKKIFFPYCINEWDSLNAEVRNAKSIHIFKEMIVTEKKQNSLFSFYDPLGVNLLTCLRLQCTHLNVNLGMVLVIQSVLRVDVMLKLKILNISSCVANFYSIQIFELFNNINKTDVFYTQLYTKEQINIQLHVYPPKKSNTLNQDIIKFVINFLKKSGRFDKPLTSFNQRFYLLLFFFPPICLLMLKIFFARK